MFKYYLFNNLYITYTCIQTRMVQDFSRKLIKVYMWAISCKEVIIECIGMVELLQIKIKIV